MFTDNLFGGKPPAPGEPRRSPLGNLAASILAVDVKVDRHANDETVHVTQEEKAKWSRPPATLSFGQKTYDGSAAQTLTAADLGALTSHQDISGKVDSSTLFSGGKVKAELLPSYVDDVLEYPSLAGFPSAGEAGKIYVAKDTNKTYRWSGTQYVEVSPAPDLSNYVQKEAGKGLFSGSYNDLSAKPTIPAAVTVDSVLSSVSENPVQNKVVKAALDGKAMAAQGAKADAALSRAEAVAGFTEWTVKRGGVDVTAQVAQPSYDSTEGAWYVQASALPSDTSDTYYGTSQDATGLTWDATDGVSGIVYTATRTRLPTMADLALKADKSEMSISEVSGDATKKNVQLKSGTAQNVVVEHQQLTPVYSQTPAFTEWTVDQNPDAAIEDFEAAWSNGAWAISCYYHGIAINVTGAIVAGVGENATMLSFMYVDENAANPSLGYVSELFTATRVRTDIIGYTLGDQTTKPLQPKGDYQPMLTAQQLANIAAVPNKADAASLPYALSAAEVLQESATDEPNDTISYGLADRTVNGISIPSGKKYVLIVMPAVSVAGHARDLVVRLVVGADGLNITWGTADADSVAVDYETEDGEFPDLSEAGTYLVRLTETAAFAAGTGGAADVPAKFLIQCQALQTAAGGAA